MGAGIALEIRASDTELQGLHHEIPTQPVFIRWDVLDYVEAGGQRPFQGRVMTTAGRGSEEAEIIGDAGVTTVLFARDFPRPRQVVLEYSDLISTRYRTTVVINRASAAMAETIRLSRI